MTSGVYKRTKPMTEKQKIKTKLNNNIIKKIKFKDNGNWNFSIMEDDIEIGNIKQHQELKRVFVSNIKKNISLLNPQILIINLFINLIQEKYDFECLQNCYEIKLKKILWNKYEVYKIFQDEQYQLIGYFILYEQMEERGFEFRGVDDCLGGVYYKNLLDIAELLKKVNDKRNNRTGFWYKEIKEDNKK